jgi:exosortase/archaeosortase family protein
VPMDIVHRQTDASKFLLCGVAASLALFGVLRLAWIEALVVLPLTRVQGDVALSLFGTPALPVAVTLACSGADALALCVGAILAYPVRWPARLAGAAGGIALILALNTMRIGTLGLAAATPAWFDLLHLYVWPASLTLAIAGYVFGWMRVAERTAPAAAADEPAPAPGHTAIPAWRPTRRFIMLTAAFAIAFAVASPLYLESAAVLSLAGLIATAAATILGALGVGAQASANVLMTGRGAFVVTQECISTPLIPVYLAALFTHGISRRRMVVGVLATLPLFTALGVARLLVVALPDALMASPTFLVHAFYQLLLGAVVIVVAARWRHGGKAGPAYAAAGLVAGVLFMGVLGSAYTAAVAAPTAPTFADPQGAVAFLPSFQIGLYLALCVASLVATRWARALAGLGVLALVHVTGLWALQALAAIGITTAVRDVRAFAVAAPVLIFVLAVRHVRAPH